MDESTIILYSKYLGGGAITIMVLLQLWERFSATLPATAKDRAENALFENLRADIERMSTDIQNIKATHELEKKAMETRIEGLEEQVRQLGFKRRESQRIAVEAYAIINRNCKPEYCVEHIKLCSMIKQIIDI